MRRLLFVAALAAVALVATSAVKTSYVDAWHATYVYTAADGHAVDLGYWTQFTANVTIDVRGTYVLYVCNTNGIQLDSINNPTIRPAGQYVNVAGQNMTEYRYGGVVVRPHNATCVTLLIRDTRVTVLGSGTAANSAKAATKTYAPIA